MSTLAKTTHQMDCVVLFVRAVQGSTGYDQKVIPTKIGVLLIPGYWKLQTLVPRNVAQIEMNYSYDIHVTRFGVRIPTSSNVNGHEKDIWGR